MRAAARMRWLLQGATFATALVLLASCGAPGRPAPVEIGQIAVQQDMRAVWSATLGKEVHLPQMVAVVQGRLAVASDAGTVAVLDAQTGTDVWRVQLPSKLNAATGFDGQRVAVVTQNNELMVLESGGIKWRQTLTAQSYTAPLVAGQRVFVFLADRTIQAFDGATGRRLWTQKRTGEPLVLQQQGVLTSFQNTLLVGNSGRLMALNPDTGVSLWETTLAVPRGINDLERLVDLVGRASRVGDSVCARAFQAQVGCVNARRGDLQWARPSVGTQGVDGDREVLYSTESNGMVQAWNRNTGDRLWDSDRLKYRYLTAPLWTPKGIVVGDSGGFLYVLSTKDGSLLNRVATKGNGFASAPTAWGDGFIILTSSGTLLAFQLP